MVIQRVTLDDALAIGRLVADFRVELNSYRGIRSEPNAREGEAEIVECLNASYPAWAAVAGGEYAGYILCKVDGSCVWVEHLFVRREHRRSGVASRLFAKAEELAASHGEDTVFNCIHPNNCGVIAFLKKHGYTVLNLIEIRKPYAAEALTGKIKVADCEFDY
ncbi:MAG: GNAT family N-acetyltransferase [Clostridia bacterium]|nr:GNAT family N-acetyltransferase [Clostridia bacterium]